MEINRGRLDFVATLGRGAVALEKGSRLVMNKIVSWSRLSACAPSPARLSRWTITSEATPATDFFSSLPPGIFDEVRGCRGTGTLTYSLHTSLDMARVDSLRFDSSLRGNDFQLTSFGNEDLGKLNTDFNYTAYNDKGDSLRTFSVGPSNPDFTPYNDVSPFLKSAITTAEDPRFFRAQRLYGTGLCEVGHPEYQGAALCPRRQHAEHAAGEKRVL